MHLITAIIFILFIGIFGLFPFFLLYLFSDFIYILFHYVFKYRQKVILKNLNDTICKGQPEKAKTLLKGVHLNLTDILLEGIKSFSMSKSQITKRHKITNPEILIPYLEKNKSIIAVAAHYANWEWGSFSASLQTKYNVVGFYKPMSNKWIDSIMRKSRSKHGTTLASIKETSLTFEKYREIPSLFLMAADQNPAQESKTIWVDFLGVETAFLNGPEKHARNNDYPVFYVDVQRVKRGYYTVELSLLADNPNELAYGEITKRYADKLASVIDKNPCDWLWSHKRWKMKRK
ncbi:MAG: lysophospholipid acyltransferase family protein [Bacteroidota bacterium]